MRMSAMSEPWAMRFAWLGRRRTWVGGAARLAIAVGLGVLASLAPVGQAAATWTAGEESFSKRMNEEFVTTSIGAVPPLL